MLVSVVSCRYVPADNGYHLLPHLPGFPVDPAANESGLVPADEGMHENVQLVVEEVRVTTHDWFGPVGR